MSVRTEPKAAEIVAGWRRVDSQDNPAGPLFSGGEYAEQELTMARWTTACGTVCTGSFPWRLCC